MYRLASPSLLLKVESHQGKWLSAVAYGGRLVPRVWPVLPLPVSPSHIIDHLPLINGNRPPDYP